MVVHHLQGVVFRAVCTNSLTILVGTEVTVFDVAFVVVVALSIHHQNSLLTHHTLVGVIWVHFDTVISLNFLALSLGVYEIFMLAEFACSFVHILQTMLNKLGGFLTFSLGVNVSLEANFALISLTGSTSLIESWTSV